MKIAVIGVQCRFPDGSLGPDQFIDNLKQGHNYCREVPANRWNPEKHYNPAGATGKSYVKHACYLDYDFRAFDALAFGFAPKEVEFIDPQQRLLLTTTWEALENAGIDINALSGQPVGVYVGGFTTDHLINQFSGQNRGAIGAHSAAGATLTMLSNRISYAFNLTGPSLSIDTACSSSLVAFATAARDIANGYCDMAIVGGVNFMLRPEYVIAMCKGRFLAPDGRSKSFDAAADGYGRGEGCGIVLLKNAEQAIADGNDILAFVDGVGVNQDGRTSGITVPNPKAQQALMRLVTSENGIDPASVDYVEAHGTGTPVGDPLEAAAIGAVYGQVKRDTPCVIGSVKSNIGHTEAAAGVAAVIKSVMMLKHNIVPPLGSLTEPNPSIPFDELNLKLARELGPLGDPDKVRRIAVNSFGYGGTNAHVILSSAQPTTVASIAPVREDVSLLAPVSARSTAALVGAAGRYAIALAGAASVTDVLFGMARRRTHFEYRVAAWGNTPPELAEALAQFGRREHTANAVSGTVLMGRNQKTVFVYTGMGPQWWAMGRCLWQSSLTYREALEEADQIFQGIAGFSVLAEMLKEEGNSRIKETEFAQPANFLLQYGLTRVLEMEGIRPDAVVGHSVGEVASAWASGMLSLEQALTVSHHRSRVQAKAVGRGGMMAAAIDEVAVQVLVDRYRGKIDIAAVNAPKSATLAGDTDVLVTIEKELQAQGVFARALEVEVPYHSRFMEPLKAELMASLDTIRPAAALRPLYSTVSGGLAGERRFDAKYWADNIREPVYFMAAIRSLLDDGYTHFVEVGPHPVLSRAILDTIKAAGAEARHIPTLSMKGDDRDSLGKALATYYVEGGAIDWSIRHPAGRPVELPTYAWATETLWRESEIQAADRLALGLRAFAQTRAPGGRTIADLNVVRLGFLDDHQVSGTALMPAAAYLEALLEAAESALEDTRSWSLQDIEIERGLVIAHDRSTLLEVEHDAETGRARVVSRDQLSPEQSTQHVTAKLCPLPGAKTASLDLAALRNQTSEKVDVETAYQQFASLGLNYQQAFRPIVELLRRPDRRAALAHLELPAALRAGAGSFVAHPALVDGAFQVALSLLGDGDGAYLPTSIKEFRLLEAIPPTAWVWITLTHHTPRYLSCDLTIADGAGRVVATITGLQCAALNPPAEVSLLPAGDLAYSWIETTRDVRSTARQLLIVHDADDTLADQFVALASRHSVPTRTALWGDAKLIDTVMSVCRYNDAVGLVLLSTAGLVDGQDPIGERAVVNFLGLVKDLALLRTTPPRLFMVTRNGMPAEGAAAPVVPAQAALIGCARVVFGEQDTLELSMIDLDREAPDLEACLGELQAYSPNNGEEVALRSTRLCPVLRPTGLFHDSEPEPVKPAESTLRFDDDGLIRIDDPIPLENELLIEFDALCLMPADKSVQEERRMGFSGHIKAVGLKQDAALVGRALCGLAPERRQTRATFSPDELVWIERPAQLPPPAASALALAQCTMDRIFASLDVISGGHALVADTPLGAALSARLLASGASVTTLPSDPAHWNETMLADRYHLIAVPLAAFDRTFGLSRRLLPGGHLIELGRRAGEMFRLPSDAASLFRPAATAQPLPSAEDLLAASQGCAQPNARAVADWMGMRGEAQVIEIVAGQSVMARPNINPRFHREGTYLITGGLGALGREAAKWLAHHGAGRVVLCSRQGPNAAGAAELVAELAAIGCQAKILALDITDAGATADALQAIDDPVAPLRGVLHAAGVVIDKFAIDLDAADVANVMRPKAQGALVLHEATRDRKLDFFVTFSSIAVIVGNKRQASYCAANAYLDGLAHARRAAGLPALSINLGAIGDVGMAADPMVQAHLRQIGLPPISPIQALAGLGVALNADVTQVVVAAAPDWEKYTSYDLRNASTPRMREVCGAFLDRDRGGRLEAISAALAGAPYAERVNALAALLAEQVASELKMDISAVSVKRPFEEIGVDSLIAVGIQVAIESAIGLSVSTMLLIGGNSAHGLAEHVLRQIGLGEDGELAAVSQN